MQGDKNQFEGLALIRMGSETTSVASGQELAHREDRPEQTISAMGSFALITNNVIGPGIMSLPALFKAAGVLPTSIALIFVCATSSLCGTFLSQTIAAIPGNSNYSMGVDFSQAFRILLGDAWYAVAETLFVVSCMVQASSGIVQTAQTIDSLLATFVFDETFALQLSPKFEVVWWSASACSATSDLDDCTPFSDKGPMVITLGYILMAALYWPIGRGHIKETMTVQFLAFFGMFAFMAVFDWECLFPHGPGGNPLRWVGDDFSRLGGIVLFNYAYSVTVPAWLQEKKTDVNPNYIIWGASLLSTVLYITFGVFTAMAFTEPGENMLTLLSSAEVHTVTRLAAAFFGILIIGCGVPVFCVMMKDVLSSGGLVSHSNALFLGSSLPYLFSWTMYKGNLLLSVLNWAGLIINGSVAFLLPVVLVALSHHYRRKYMGEPQSSVLNAANLRSYGTSGAGADVEKVVDAESSPLVEEEGRKAARRPMALPLPLQPYIEHIAIFIIFAFVTIIGLTIWVDIEQGMQ